MGLARLVRFAEASEDEIEASSLALLDLWRDDPWLSRHNCIEQTHVAVIDSLAVPINKGE